MSELQGSHSGDRRGPHDPSPTSPSASDHQLVAGELPGATPAAPMSAIHPKALLFTTPAAAGTRGAAAPTPGTAAGGISGAKGSAAPRSTVKVVKSRFMEPKSTPRPIPKPSDRRGHGTGRAAPPKRPPQQPSRARSAQTKENVPTAATPSSSSAAAAAASGGPQDPGSAAKGQAELRAQLAAFRERKTKPPPEKASSGTPMQQQQQQPMSSASRHIRASTQTPSEHRPPLSASSARGQRQQQHQWPNAASASARKALPGREAAGSFETGGTGLSGKEEHEEGATKVASTPLQQQGGLLSSTHTTPPSGGSTASAASLKEKVLTQDSFMRERYLQHWRELQWHHLNARASGSLERRKEEAEASLSRVAVMVAALTRHVTQQRIRLGQSRAAAQLEQAVADQMPELVPMQEFQAVLKAGVVATSESLRSAMLQVPLLGGASAQEGPLVMARALAAGEAALDAQAADVAALLGDSSDVFASGHSHSLEDEQPDPLNEEGDGSSLDGGVAELGSTCEALRRAACSESSLLNTCAGLLSRLTELHLQEGSLQAHAAQLRRAPLKPADSLNVI